MIKKYRAAFLLFSAGLLCGFIIHAVIESKSKKVITDIFYKVYIMNEEKSAEQCALNGDNIKEINHMYNAMTTKNEFYRNGLDKIIYEDSLSYLYHKNKWEKKLRLTPEMQLIADALQYAKIALLLEKNGLNEAAQKEWDRAMSITPSQKKKVLAGIYFLCKINKKWPKELLNSKLLAAEEAKTQASAE